MSQEKKQTLTSKFLDVVKQQVPLAINKYTSTLVMKVLGKSKGLYVWIAENVFKYLWKRLKPHIEEFQYKLDHGKFDKASIEAYNKLKESGASPDELKKKRLDILNGNSN